MITKFFKDIYVNNLKFQSSHVIPITNIPPPKKNYEYSLPRSAASKEIRRRGGSSRDVKVRKDFSETFCWTDVVTKS